MRRLIGAMRSRAAVAPIRRPASEVAGPLPGWHRRRMATEAEAPMVPLRRRLFLLAIAALVPLALIAGLGLLALVERQRAEARRAGIELTRALATAVDAELGRSISVIEAVVDLADARRARSRRVPSPRGPRGEDAAALARDRARRSRRDAALDTGLRLRRAAAAARRPRASRACAGRSARDRQSRGGRGRRDRRDPRSNSASRCRSFAAARCVMSRSRSSTRARSSRS